MVSEFSSELFKVFFFMIKNGPFLGQGSLIICDRVSVPSGSVENILRRSKKEPRFVHSENRKLLNIMLLALWKVICVRFESFHVTVLIDYISVLFQKLFKNLKNLNRVAVTG